MLFPKNSLAIPFRAFVCQDGSTKMYKQLKRIIAFVLLFVFVPVCNPHADLGVVKKKRSWNCKLGLQLTIIFID